MQRQRSVSIVQQAAICTQSKIKATSFQLGHKVESINILDLVLFAIIFGVALKKLGPDGKLLIPFFKAFNDATMWQAPMDILSLVASKIVEKCICQLFMSLSVLNCLLGLTIHRYDGYRLQ